MCTKIDKKKNQGFLPFYFIRLHLSVTCPSIFRHLYLNPSPLTPSFHSNTDIMVRPTPPQLLCWYSDESLTHLRPSLWKRHLRTHLMVEQNTKWISELTYTPKERKNRRKTFRDPPKTLLFLNHFAFSTA